MTRIPTSTPSDRESARRARVAAITAGALTRQRLGQAATYRRLDSGEHQVSIGGRTTVGATLVDTIDAARA
jgi:hypothetical protein